MEKPLIKLENVKKSYFLTNKEEIPVLKGIDLKIFKKEFVILMGESGSGKSTLLNIIGCLHGISSGEYSFQGEDISFLKDDDMLSYIRNRKMGFIFQQFHLIPKLTALENVMLPSLYLDMTNLEKENKAKMLLEKVGLGDKLINRPGELSGGQQQRVSIARSLMNDPEILLADEPTGALDSETSVEVMKIIMDLKNDGKTIVMVTHTPLVARYADRIIFLKDGKVENCNFKLEEHL
ncbi:MAG: ABC transporter ATP-binding protein [Candidatus Gracilibacteria bacterium]|nr:ABC transporter ATP-binding protein [Candidatus Gracilibacteria bacterium]MDD2908438.1 ABC transporter ATP-binding protein [Candidatus Gracilibacteria bacterium]